MLLKRKYDLPDGWEPQRDTEGHLVNQPQVTGLHLIHTGTHPEQNFSQRFVTTGLQEGWLSMSKGKLTLHTDEADLAYTVLKVPGMYCCHCDMKLDDDPSGMSGREHVEKMHGGDSSPNMQNPAGFRVTHAYECMLDEEQHAQWKVPEYAKVSHSRWKDTQGDTAAIMAEAEAAVATPKTVNGDETGVA